jgi:putative transposase
LLKKEEDLKINFAKQPKRSPMRAYTIYSKFNKLNSYIKPEQKLPGEAVALKKQLEQAETLVEKKVPWGAIKDILGISRSNYYRLKKLVATIGLLGLIRRSKRPKSLRTSKIPQEVRDKILLIRKDNPTYGKAKIAVILLRDYDMRLSESSVGRVLSKLIAQGKIRKSCSAWRIKGARKFDSHAKRWVYGAVTPQKPGEMVQVDHMSVAKNQCRIKHFQAWDPISKYIYADAFSNASSHCAKTFLLSLVAKAPFKISSIQVDGGSEFMKDFENACKDLGISLYVLPPKSPKYNGGVERGNRTFREEFYARHDLLADTVGAFKLALKPAVLKYNSYRPHKSLDYLTPLQYIAQLFEASTQSNML